MATTTAKTEQRRRGQEEQEQRASCPRGRGRCWSLSFSHCDFRPGRDCGNKNEPTNSSAASEGAIISVEEFIRERRPSEPGALTTCNGGIISDAVFMDRLGDGGCDAPGRTTRLNTYSGNRPAEHRLTVFQVHVGDLVTRFVLVLLDHRLHLTLEDIAIIRLLSSDCLSQGGAIFPSQPAGEPGE